MRRRYPKLRTVDRRCRLLLVVAATLLLVSCGGSASESESTSASTLSSTESTAGGSLGSSESPVSDTAEHTPVDESGAEPRNDGALLGAWVAVRDGGGDEARRQAVLDHEASIGRPLALVNEFFRFDLEWAMDRLHWHVDRGTGLMVSWNGGPYEQIIDGSSDELIRQRARWTRDLEVPLLLRFFWEPDAEKGERWGYRQDPARYEAVWRHVRAIFDEEGVTNAKWVWTPTTWHFVTGSAPSYYPGDDVVDVIGADGYLWSPCQGGVESAEDVFGAFLEWAQPRPQPILIAEWGADADAGNGTKADFVDEMAELFLPMDRLLGLVVFDAVDPGGRGCDWRIDSDSVSLDRYRDLANDPRLAGTIDRIGEL